MGISLVKGSNVSLSKEVPGLKAIKIGCGWNPQEMEECDFDIDASVFLCNDEGKIPTERDFIFYNNLTNQDETVVHTGDNRTGEGSGDDEVIMVSLKQLKPNITKVVVVITIYDALHRNQNFGMIDNAYIRIIDAANDTEIARYDLTEDFSTATAVAVGEVYFKNGEWKFKALGQGSSVGLAEFKSKYSLV